MRAKIALVIVLPLLVLFLGWGTCVAATDAGLGSRFADVYSAFAPFFLLHRSYADHLFLGTDVEVPVHLVESCQSFSYQLGLLQIDLVEQTTSQMTETTRWVLRLRTEQAAYCGRYADTLIAIAEALDVDLDLLAAASDAGLFAGVQTMSDLLDLALDAALTEIGEDIGPWEFAVAFSMRGLLSQDPLERIDADLMEILYGSEDAEEAPISVPDAVAEAMIRLIELAGRDLAPEEAALAVVNAEIIYDFILGETADAGP